MISAAPANANRFCNQHPDAPDAQWIDVRAAGAEGYWVPEEGRALDRLLAHLAAVGVRLRDVIVIPFPRRRPLYRLAPRSARAEGAAGWHDPHRPGQAGQDRDPHPRLRPRHPAARGWAASTPNLLSVAVNRAHRRLIAIGDRRARITQRHFDTLAHHLTTHHAGPGEYPRGSRPTPLDTPTAANPDRNQRVI